MPKNITKPEAVTVNVRGADWSISPDAFDDWELLERLNSGNGMEVLSAMSSILGDSQMAQAKELIRDTETGRVSVTGMTDLLTEVFGAVGAAGNR